MMNFWAIGMLTKPTYDAEIRLASTMWKLNCSKENLIKPADKPNKNIVNIVLLGTLNRIPKPTAAIPDQKETSSKCIKVFIILF